MAITGAISTGKTIAGASGATSLMTAAIDNGYSTAIYEGDFVQLVDGYLILCPETAKPDGVFRGCEYWDASGTYKQLNYFPAGVSNTKVIDDIYNDVKATYEPVEGRVFQMVTSDAAVTQADIGDVKRIKSAGSESAYGTSAAVVDMDASVTSELRLVRIRGIAEIPGNALGTGTVVEVEVFDVDIDT